MSHQRPAPGIGLRPLTLPALALAVLLGCEENIRPEAQTRQPTASPANESSGTAQSLSNQPNSALAGAKRSAKKTVQSLEDKQRELSREIDRQLEDD